MLIDRLMDEFWEGMMDRERKTAQGDKKRRKARGRKPEASVYDIPLPPEEYRISKNHSYRIAERYLKLFIELCGLTPDGVVLDAGCGSGRIAVPFTKYLTKTGRYEGFDIVREWIDWCQREITSRYENFHFIHADIYNGRYNPDGKVRASEYQFPYENNTFDLVFLTSVFTHMLPNDLENYLSEVARVLKKGGRCLITYFLINQESQSLIDSGLASKKRDFKHHREGYRTTNPNRPEARVAYDEADIRKLYPSLGLSIVEPIHYGRWCGRKEYLRGQDIIVAMK